MQKSSMCCAKTSPQALEPQSDVSQLFHIAVNDNATLNIAYLHAQVPSDLKLNDPCQGSVESSHNTALCNSTNCDQHLVNSQCNTAHIIEDCKITSDMTACEHFEYQNEHNCTDVNLAACNDNLEIPGQLYLHVDYSNSLPIVG